MVPEFFYLNLGIGSLFYKVLNINNKIRRLIRGLLAGSIAIKKERKKEKDIFDLLNKKLIR